MESIHLVAVHGRACCAVDEEVWVAQQAGGIAVFSGRTGARIGDVDVRDKAGTAAAQVTHMTLVFEEVWASTTEGKVLLIHSTTRTIVASPDIPETEKVPIVGLFFNSDVVVVAAASGSLYLYHPLTRQRLGTLCTSTSPCTAAAQFYSFVVGGDAEGALYLWDPTTGECILYHGESRSSVVALLHERSTGTIWVSRANENVDVYTVKSGALLLHGRVVGIGRVTSMVAVSGSVVATTSTRRVVQIDACTMKLRTSNEGAHENFIHGCCKAMHRESAQVWTMGNDATLRVWQVEGKYVPVEPLPPLTPAAQACLASSAEAKFDEVQSALRTGIQGERKRRADLADDLRKARDEVQELRLRVARGEEKLLCVEKELASERKHRVEVEALHAKLTKDLTDLTSNMTSVERERSSLRAEVAQLKCDLSKAHTDTSTKQSEKSAVEKQLSEEKTKTGALELRVRDAESRLSSLQAEYRRLSEKMGSTAAAAGALSQPESALIQDSQAKNIATLNSELEQARKMNLLMSSAMASMEYTIRRCEEEDRDLTALLNAFRHRVADRVSDPNLAALLLATVVRNAPRFDLECDELTKAKLMERNSPFLQFIQTLRATDPEAYEKLVRYLQNPSLAQGLPADAQTLLDRFLNLATKENGVSNEDVAQFKKSIPALADSVTLQSASLGGAGIASSALRDANGISAGSLAALLRNSSGESGNVARGPLSKPGGLLGNSSSGLTDEDQEVVNSAILRGLRGQRLIDENYVREQQVMFEFILKTRRLLVESLSILHKRTVSARQVLEALCLNSSAATAAATPTSPSRKSLQPMQNIFSGIVRELEDLAEDIVNRFLTGAEKQRIGMAP